MQPIVNRRVHLQTQRVIVIRHPAAQKLVAHGPLPKYLAQIA